MFKLSLTKRKSWKAYDDWKEFAYYAQQVTYWLICLGLFGQRSQIAYGMEYNEISYDKAQKVLIFNLNF